MQPTVAGQLGMERRGQHRPLAADHRADRRRCPRPSPARARRGRGKVASTSTSGPAYSTTGARMNTAWTRLGAQGRRPPGRTRTSRPGGRSRCGARSCRWPRSAVGRAGRRAPSRPAGSSRRRCRRPADRPTSASASGSNRPEDSSSSDSVVDSPPGRISPSSPARSSRLPHRPDPFAQRFERQPRARGRRPAGRGRPAPSSPSSARPAGSAVTSRARPDAPRACPSPGRAWPRPARSRPWPRSASVKWVVASTMARAIRAGLALLKMPEPTNTASAPELHDQRGVGRGGDPAGAEQRHRQAAGGGDLLDQADRRGQLLGPAVQLGRVGLGDLADVAEDRAQVADGLDDVAGPGLALGADHGRPLGDAPQRLARGWWRRTRRGPSKTHLSMWWASSAGVSTSLSSM